jgi:hypothetical protein
LIHIGSTRAPPHPVEPEKQPANSGVASAKQREEEEEAMWEKQELEHLALKRKLTRDKLLTIELAKRLTNPEHKEQARKILQDLAEQRKLWDEEAINLHERRRKKVHDIWKLP